MFKSSLRSIWRGKIPASLLSAILLTVVVPVALAADADTNDNNLPFGLDRRIPWRGSKVVGSPEPPPPYTVEKVYSRVKWASPLYVAPEPGTQSLLVVLQGGERDRPSRIVRIASDFQSDRTEPFLSISNRLIYSVTFDPGYSTNRYLYVFTNGRTTDSERTNRVARYEVDAAPPYACKPDSEHRIIEWRSAGHDGGGMVFGHDGMFYISTGDGTSDSDGWVTGQDLSDLAGGILRIDIRATDQAKPYAVPPDNPFVAEKGARPELWAYGLRNPWRLCVDDKSGQIWTGNNGQDLWETAHLVRRGENYGWSVYEGSHPFYANRKMGPTPLVPPTLEHHHSEMRSLTGGIVYYGSVFPELNGAYIYGDYSTGKILGARHDGSNLTWKQALAESQIQISGFAVNQQGQLLIVDHGGSIFRLVRTPEHSPVSKFPTRLSETGLFVSTPKHQVQPGVLPYSIVAPGWADGAVVDRFIALPDESRIDKAASSNWEFPEGTVLVQTLSLEIESGQPGSQRRIETRLLTRQNAQWVGYSYRWNNAQTDAVLVASKGEDADFFIRAKDGVEHLQAWRFPSRNECMICHSRAANFVLGVTPAQLNRAHHYGAVQDNQLRTFEHIGLFKSSSKPSRRERRQLVDPYDSTLDLEARARSYLHVNCSVCHVDAGGGNAKMELGISTSADRMNVLNARPQHDTFGIDNAMIVAPGNPDRSVLLQRLSRRGRGQMPPLFSNKLDEQAIALFKEWIGKMPNSQQFVRDWKMEDLSAKLGQVKQGRSLENGRTAFRQTGCAQCHRFEGEGGSVGPDLTGIGRKLSLPEIAESILLPSKAITEGYATTEIETRAGQVITGRIEHETAQQLTIRPLSGLEEIVTVSKANILQRTLSKVSNMPTGIANTLSEDALLDLLAYLVADAPAASKESSQ